MSNTSYLSFYKRSKRAETANLYAKQAQEELHRKLKFLEISFELEKQKIVNEVKKAQ